MDRRARFSDDDKFSDPISSPAAPTRGKSVHRSPHTGRSRVLPSSENLLGDDFDVQMHFVEGESVEYFSTSLSKWVPATVIGNAGTDLYDLQLFSGEECKVDVRSIRLLQDTEEMGSMGGAEMDTPDEKPSRHVHMLTPSGSNYDYIDDDESESRLKSDGLEDIFEIGDRILCRYRSGNEFLPCTIVNRTKVRETPPFSICISVSLYKPK